MKRFHIHSTLSLWIIWRPPDHTEQHQCWTGEAAAQQSRCVARLSGWHRISPDLLTETRVSERLLNKFACNHRHRLLSAVLRLFSVLKMETSENWVFPTITFNDMNYVFVWTDKRSVHRSLYAELLPQGLWVPLNQGVVSSCLVDVDFIILES